MRRRTLAPLLLCWALSAAAMVELPGTLESEGAPLRLLGSGRMSWFGLHIYDAALWAPRSPVGFDTPFALVLRYTREFKGERIAERSVVEIERLGYRDRQQLARWGEAMKRLFPDVRAGEKLTGVYRPGRGAAFYHDDRPLGAIDDPEFARAFFSIWLDPRTREPKLRERLMGVR